MGPGKAALTSEFRDGIIQLDGVRKINVSQRAGSIFPPAGNPIHLYLIESGFVKLAWTNSVGLEVIFRFSGPGDLFGDDTLWSERNVPITAQALEDAVLYQIPREVFLRAAAGRPEIWRVMAGLLAERQSELEGRLLLLSTQDVEFRILHSLAELARLFGDGVDECPVPVTQKELASYVGATRETTSSTLNSVARRGLVRLGRRLLVVPSLAAIHTAVKERSARTAVSGNV